MRRTVRPRLKKADVVAMFTENVLPGVQARETPGRVDRIARWEAWSFYTDALCKAGYITDHQYRTWVSPVICNRETGATS